MLILPAAVCCSWTPSLLTSLHDPVENEPGCLGHKEVFSSGSTWLQSLLCDIFHLCTGIALHDLPSLWAKRVGIALVTVTASSA